MPTGESLLDAVRAALEADHVRLPVLHPVAVQLQGVLRGEEVGASQVSKLIAEDQSLAGEVLRLANSAFFAGLKKVATIRDAVVRLGTKRVANLVIVVTQKASHRAKDPQVQRYMLDLRRHALGCAMGSRWVAQRSGHTELEQEAMLAGLLHDMGKLLLLYVLDDIQHRSSGAATRLPDDVVLEVLDTLHTEQGCRLAERWNLPEDYSQVVLHHHDADYDRENVLLTIVRLVDAASRKVGVSLTPDPSLVLSVTPEADRLGLNEVALAELELAIEDAVAGETA